MTIWEILLLALALSADAFAVSVCNGLTAGGSKKMNFIMAGSFGLAQALFPLIGLALGTAFLSLIAKFDHWIAFGLLLVLGAKMLFDAKKGDGECEIGQLTYKTVAVQAVATAIDALAAGIGFAALQVEPFSTVAIIGAVTFAVSLAGVFAARKLAQKSKRICGISRVAGGLILIGIGVKILIQHLCAA